MDELNTRGQDDCLIFLHIPKTAGTTFAQILQRRYRNGALEWLGSEGDLTADEAFEALSPARKAEVAAVMGHINFGGHRLMPRPARYITFLRHPVDRIVSHYYHVLRNPRHYLHDEVRARNMDLAAYAASGLSVELQNDQTRMISGLGDHASDGDMLETAYRNIEGHFNCVGITERFAESLVLASYLYGWSVPYYRDANIGANKPRRVDISLEAIAIIEHQNQCDLELYHHADRRLSEHLQKNLPNWKMQTRRFLWRNRQYVRLTQASDLLRRGAGAGVRRLKGGAGARSNFQPQSTMNTML